MKNSALYLILLLIVATSCNQSEIKQLENENEDLKLKLEQREEDINNFMQVFNEIEENLAEVRIKEKLIVKSSGNNENGDRVETVKNNIKAIDDLMQRNRKNLKNLSDKLKSSAGENNQLRRMIDNLELMIKDKDREILELVGKLEDLNFEVQDLYSSISDLKLENLEQSRLISNQEDELNAAWFIIGENKDLIDKGIIDKEGGIIGIGAVKTLAENVDQSLFTKIDIRTKTIFPLDAKKVTLVTTHPSDSYLIRYDEESKRYTSFEITLPEEFWKSSKYLVLSIKK
jgi:hypothetical protein